jgi:hypothetical protein
MSPPPLVRMLLSKSPGHVFIEIVLGFFGCFVRSLLVVLLGIVLIIVVFTTMEAFANIIEWIVGEPSIGNIKQCRELGPCSICFEEMGTGCVELPCAHVFHKTCAYRWHSINPTCALCRQ